jgi:uncharacterized damage-inducible protein DinB
MTKPQHSRFDLLDRMLRHDAWTTQRFLEIAESLTDDQLDHAFDIGHKTIRKTFSHLIWNMECWTDLMKGSSIRPRLDERASIGELSSHLQTISCEIYDFARQVIDQGRENDTFLDHIDSPPQRKSFGTTILHVATHSMHHRGQLLFMLRRSGVSNLPEGDALSWEIATQGSRVNGSENYQ